MNPQQHRGVLARGGLWRIHSADVERHEESGVRRGPLSLQGKFHRSGSVSRLQLLPSGCCCLGHVPPAVLPSLVTLFRAFDKSVAEALLPDGGRMKGRNSGQREGYLLRSILCLGPSTNLAQRH
ncbi:unnamed protein product [Closterium sp. NIES-54]